MKMAPLFPLEPFYDVTRDGGIVWVQHEEGRKELRVAELSGNIAWAARTLSRPSGRSSPAGDRKPDGWVSSTSTRPSWNMTWNSFAPKLITGVRCEARVRRQRHRRILCPVLLQARCRPRRPAATGHHPYQSGHGGRLRRKCSCFR